MYFEYESGLQFVPIKARKDVLFASMLFLLQLFKISILPIKSNRFLRHHGQDN